MRIEKIYEVMLDDPSMIWRDDPDLASLGLVSTSSMMDFIHRITYDLIPTPPDSTTVVVSSSVRHLSPLRIGSRIRMHIMAVEGSEGSYIVRVEIFRGPEKAFEAEVVRRIVPKDQIRRSALEKAAEA